MRDDTFLGFCVVTFEFDGAGTMDMSESVVGANRLRNEEICSFTFCRIEVIFCLRNENYFSTTSKDGTRHLSNSHYLPPATSNSSKCFKKHSRRGV